MNRSISSGVSNICEYCNNSFSSKNSLDRHQKTAKYCLSTRSETKVEKSSNEDTIKYIYMCEKCEDCFNLKDDLESHKKTCLKDKGFLYCFYTDCMPGIYKIGLTTRSLEKRLKEANTGTYVPPIPYRIVFAKKVNNVKEKEGKIHQLLTRYSKRVNKKKEFFRITEDEVYLIFSLLDGQWVRGERKIKKKVSKSVSYIGKKKNKKSKILSPISEED